jgi:hypothetical protein
MRIDDHVITVRYIPAEEGGGYAAYIERLGKNAFVGDGETPEEAVKQLEQVYRDIAAKRFVQAHVTGEIIAPVPEDWEFIHEQLMLELPTLTDGDEIREAADKLADMHLINYAVKRHFDWVNHPEQVGAVGETVIGLTEDGTAFIVKGTAEYKDTLVPVDLIITIGG